MIICNHSTNGLKGQQLIAQGNALGIFGHTSSFALKGQKPSITMLLPFQGESTTAVCTQGVALG